MGLNLIVCEKKEACTKKERWRERKESLVSPTAGERRVLSLDDQLEAELSGSEDAGGRKKNEAKRKRRGILGSGQNGWQEGGRH